MTTPLLSYPARCELAGSLAALCAAFLNPFHSSAVTVVLAAALLSLPVSRKARAEDKADIKSHFYLEDYARVRVITEYVELEKDLNEMFTLKLRGLYSTMSGATPTGTPPAAQSLAPLAPGGGAVATISGPSPIKTRGKNSVPTLRMEDVRKAAHGNLITRLDDHTLDLGFVYSTENDYDSTAFSLTDTIAFNQKNTELIVGASGTLDVVSTSRRIEEWHKDSVDAILGVNQLLGPETVLGVRFTCGRSDGFLADPYKSVELNGQIVKETRPDRRDRATGLVSLTQYLDPLHASIEGSYRVGGDTFGVTSHTVELAWYQKIGKRLIVSPLFRYYRQRQRPISTAWCSRAIRSTIQQTIACPNSTRFQPVSKRSGKSPTGSPWTWPTNAITCAAPTA
ncbi:MAG: DUF3570 domain-containing protein [Verrucomicrobiae bacterium]|nr:DUF3570 domain-containing protein [Verrucomicrobiae bacterium]